MFTKSKNLFSVILLIVFSILSARCTSSDEPARDLSTPSSRLVGHWGVVGDGNLVPKDEFAFQKWFSEFNDDGIGAYSSFVNGVMVTSGEDRIDTFAYYNVLSEDGDIVTLGFFLKDQNPPDPFPDSLKKSFEVSKDGQELRPIGSKGEFQYIDSKTEPGG